MVCFNVVDVCSLFDLDINEQIDGLCCELFQFCFEQVMCQFVNMYCFKEVCIKLVQLLMVQLECQCFIVF